MEPLLHNQLYTTFPMAAPSRTFLLFPIPISPFLYKPPSPFSFFSSKLHLNLQLIPMASSSVFSTTLFLSLLFSPFFITSSASNFHQSIDITWGDGRAQILNNGDLLTLSLDKPSGSGFQSRNEYLYGKIDMQIKLVPGNSAGTVTAYYVSFHLTQFPCSCSYSCFSFLDSYGIFFCDFLVAF